MYDYIVIPIVAFFASFVHCLLGFGDALLAMPFLLIFYDLRVADTIANNYAFLIGIILTGYSFKFLSAYKLETSMLFSMYTLLSGVGMIILKIINQNAIILLLSITLIFYPFLILWLNKKSSFKLNGYASLIFGGLAGFLGATTSINGPALVGYAQLRKFNKDVFIAILQPLFLWGSVINFYGYYKIGLFNWHLTLIMGASTPLILLNAYLCKKIRDKVNQQLFGHLVSLMIFASGIMLFIKHI